MTERKVRLGSLLLVGVVILGACAPVVSVEEARQTTAQFQSQSL